MNPGGNPGVTRPLVDVYAGRKDDDKVSKYGAGVKATTGQASTQWNELGAFAEGPRVSAEANVASSHDTEDVEATAMTEIGLGKAGVKAGAVEANVGLNANTGVRIGTAGVEANVLGFGFAVGKKCGINTPIGGFSFGF